MQNQAEMKVHTIKAFCNLARMDGVSTTSGLWGKLERDAPASSLGSV